MVKATWMGMITKHPDLVWSKMSWETVSHSSPWRKLGEKVRNLFEIPRGYQDETGFHYGQQPSSTKAQWPTT